MEQQQQLQQFDLNKFLEKINCTVEQPSHEYLSKLIKNSKMYIPFENLDFVRRKRITTNINKTYSKIICSKRGGLCWELNTLLLETLKQLKFDVSLIQALVYNPATGVLGEKFDHTVLLVKFGEEEKQRYIVDIGFGDFFSTPLPFFDFGQIITDSSGSFKIEPVEGEEGFYHIYGKKPNKDEYYPIYKFDIIPRQPQDFEEWCQKQFSNPEFFFNKVTLVRKETQDGEIILMGEKLSIIKNGERVDTKIENIQEFYQHLEQYFGIKDLDIEKKIEQ